MTRPATGSAGIPRMPSRLTSSVRTSRTSRVSLIVTSRRSLAARRTMLGVLADVGADEFGLGKHMFPGRLPKIVYARVRILFKVRDVQRNQPEVIMVRAVPWRRLRAVVTAATEIVERHAKPLTFRP